MQNNNSHTWPGEGKEYLCPHCQKNYKLMLYNLATFSVCPKCGYYNNVFNGDSQTFGISEVDRPFQWKAGTRGTLKEINWVLCGGLLRKEKGASYYWQEYCLYHPLHGFAWLQEYEGNWILLRKSDDYPRINIETTAIVDDTGETYHLFLRYKTVLLRAFGEFPYDIIDSRNKLVKEYIAPPIMFLRKDYNNEVQWFRGEHLDRAELFNAFGKPENPLPKDGRGSIQPQFWGMHYRKFTLFSCFAAVLIIVFHWVFSDFSQTNEFLFNHNFYLHKTDSNSVKPYISSSFYINGSTNNVEFFTTNNLSQDWLEMEFNLVNEETDEEFNLTSEMAYYSGYDDEGSWVEGSKEKAEILNEVPPGKYHLMATPFLSPSFAPVTVELTLRRAVPFSGNVYWFLFFLAILTYIQYLRVMSFERKRWSNSNYSTYDHRSWWERNLGGDE